MAETPNDLMVCPHVPDGFKEDHVVCQLDTDQGKLNVATCRSCIEEVLKGNMEAWDKYKAVTKQHAAALGVIIGGESSRAAS